ncbi:MAG TPA: chorismate mutase [Sphingomonas sp.]|nr:chorismate mutase [Sphingomonas sp.]
MTVTSSPERCRTMADVRAGVDQIDIDLVALLAQRFAFIRAAARIKQERDAVRDENRKTRVIDNVRAQARAAGISETLVAALWEQLVEGSIAYELEHFDALRREASAR